MKACTKCHIQKNYSEFSPRRSARDGLTSNCRQCCNQGSAKWRANNGDKIKVQSAVWYANNKEYAKQVQSEYYHNNKDRKSKSVLEWKLNNPEKVQEINRKSRLNRIPKKKNYDREYGQANPDKIASKAAKRRAAKLLATPKWLTPEHKEQINAIYKEAKRLELLDGIKRHVDHIVPLKGKTVMGLHVPWNLQVLTQSENCRKTNKITHL